MACDSPSGRHLGPSRIAFDDAGAQGRPELVEDLGMPAHVARDVHRLREPPRRGVDGREGERAMRDIRNAKSNRPLSKSTMCSCVAGKAMLEAWNVSAGGVPRMRRTAVGRCSAFRKVAMSSDVSSRMAYRFGSTPRYARQTWRATRSQLPPKMSASAASSTPRRDSSSARSGRCSGGVIAMSFE